jgi:hypothetical protein
MAGLADEGGRRPVRFRLWSGKLAVVQEDTSVCASEIHMHTIARIIPLSDDRSLLARMLARSIFPRGVSCSIFPRGVSLFPPCSVSLLPPCLASSLPCFLPALFPPCLVSWRSCALGRALFPSRLVSFTPGFIAAMRAWPCALAANITLHRLSGAPTAAHMRLSAGFRRLSAGSCVVRRQDGAGVTVQERA